MSQLAHFSNHNAVNYRIFELCEQINAGCDHEFDARDEELEREFAELRLHLTMYA